MQNFEFLIGECDLDIRAGQPRKVALRLAGLNLVKVPAQWRLALAQICRRAGLYPIGIRLLSGVVLQLNGEPMATSAEFAEYAVLLLRSGALGEALARLQKINVDDVPEVLLYRAFAHFSVWDYATAVPLLQQYLQTPLKDYARLVGRTNLAFAYAETRKDDLALHYLDETILLTREMGLRQLESTCHTLRAQVHIQRREFKEAREELSVTGQLSDTAQTNDNFLAVKWGLILDGLESNSIKPFERLSELAIANRSWESWRESDFYSLRVKPNRERFVHMYFGTPFPEFRNLILQEFGDLPQQPIYVLGPKSAPRLDLRTGEIDGREALAFGGKLHQLFELLLRDFYQPLRIAGIFTELFRGEQFNIETSPGRVHQVISRARKWLKAEKIPVTLDETEGFYSMRLTGEFSFRVSLERISLEPGNQKFEKLKELFADGREFLAREAQEKLGISKATMHELLKWGIAQGKISRIGSSQRSATYAILATKSCKKVS